MTQTLEVHQKRVSWSFAPELTKPLESLQCSPTTKPLSGRGEEITRNREGERKAKYGPAWKDLIDPQMFGTD